MAAFCDELLRNAKTYTENWHDALNRDVLEKLRRGEEAMTDIAIETKGLTKAFKETRSPERRRP